MELTSVLRCSGSVVTSGSWLEPVHKPGHSSLLTRGECRREGALGVSGRVEEVRYTRITLVEDRKRTCDKRSHGHWEERTARGGWPW